jgi:hypothetical protein
MSNYASRHYFLRYSRCPTPKHEGEAATTAVLHFYEPFLEASDPDLRKELGAWYTRSQCSSGDTLDMDQHFLK